jgi:hypothetical protein
MRSKISLAALALVVLVAAGWTMNAGEAYFRGILYAGSAKKQLTDSNGSLYFAGATGANLIELTDNLAEALVVEEASADYLTFVTTNSSEAVVVEKLIGFTSAAVTAGTTQTQAGATAITVTMNRVTTGNANDGVALPGGTSQVCVFVSNISANALKVWPSNADNDTINGGSADAEVAHPASKAAWYCTMDGTAWLAFPSPV